MPHSSGGGSHGGGSHGGGSHSHSYSSSGSGNRGPRISRKPFLHAHRYRYYNLRGEERYIYSTEKPKKQSIPSLIFSLLFSFIFVFMGLGMFGNLGTELRSAGILKPKALKPLGTYEEAHIADNADVITDKVSLEQRLQNFENLTGICPFVETVYDSDWEDAYYDLEDYAYHLYLQKFDDEQHFLIVYSEPENTKELDYIDWQWEGMQGDDTDSILTEHKFVIFQMDLQTYMEDETVSVGEAFEKAFTNSLDYIMDKNMSGASLAEMIFPLGMTLFWNGVVWYIFVTLIKNFIDSRRDYTEMPDDGVYRGSSSGQYDYGKYDESQFDYGKYGDPQDGYKQ